MQPTVRDVMALPVVQAGAPEVVGTAPLDRPVRWVHVADVPDMSNLLQGGELVLTTGQALTDDAVGVRYLQGLAEAGAAGLFVELGRYIDTVSPQLADAADRVGLPVVALHRQIRVRRSDRGGAPFDRRRAIRRGELRAPRARGVHRPQHETRILARDRRRDIRLAGHPHCARRPQPAGAGIRRARDPRVGVDR